MDRSGFLEMYQDAATELTTPAEADRVGVTNARDTARGSADRIDPPLNPSHPNHNKNLYN